ncbi:multi-sensor hybrid histidine kinase, partial [mine drainage metagenome]
EVAEEALRRVAREGRAIGLSLTLRQPGGDPKEISYNASTFTDERGSVVGIIANVRDVTLDTRTRRRLAEETVLLKTQRARAEWSSRRNSELVANMSHELRTPLATIIGFSEMMLADRHDRLTPEQREFLADIQDSGNHLLSLINGVLDLAKADAGKLRLFPSAVRLEPTIAAAAASLLPQLHARSQTLRIDV